MLASDLAFAVWESGELAEVSAVLAEARVSRDPVTAAIATIIDNTIDFLTVGTTRAEERARRARGGSTRARGRGPCRRSRPLLVEPGGRVLGALPSGRGAGRVRARARAIRALGKVRPHRRLHLAGSVRIRVRTCTRQRGDRTCRGARRGVRQLDLARGRGEDDTRQALCDERRDRPRPCPQHRGARYVPSRGDGRERRQPRPARFLDRRAFAATSTPGSVWCARR